MRRLRRLIKISLLPAILLISSAVAFDAAAGRPGQRKQDLLSAAQRELDLTSAASDLERGRTGLERERESLEWASELLEHRGHESMRRLDAYRRQHGAHVDESASRARALYKLARGGGMLAAMFDDEGARDTEDRVTRGRTIRWLVERDLDELAIHVRAERRAQTELLMASRELAALQALATVSRMQSLALTATSERLAPALASVHRERRRAERRRPNMSREEKRLLRSLSKERRKLMRHKGLDLLEKDALVRPIKNAKIVGRYGDYEDKILRVPMHRNGVEMRAKPNAKVRAIAPGQVAFVGALPGFERVVVVDHGGGYLSLTARLMTVDVEEDQDLEAGVTLGRVGPKSVDDGLGTTAYVEVRHGERPIDPTPYIK